MRPSGRHARVRAGFYPDLQQCVKHPEEDQLERLEKEGKKRRELGRIVEFDPDLGEMVVKRRRKRGQTDEWEEYKG